MSDLIRRSDAIQALRKLGHEVVVIDKVCSLGVAAEFIDAIRAIPSADLNAEFAEWAKLWFKKELEADRPQGEWIRTGRTNIYGGIEVQCSNCGDKVMVQHLEDEWFCRHCGADMGMKGADDE